MQIIFSDEETEILCDALPTEIQELTEDIRNRKQRGLDEKYREDNLKKTEALRDRLVVYVYEA